VRNPTSRPMFKPLPPPWDRFVPFVQKFVVWAAFFAILWFLRPFFFLVFLTFVFGYLLEHIVELLERRIRSRRTRVVLGFLCVLAILVGLGFVVAPDLAKQVKSLRPDLERQVSALNGAIVELREKYPTVRDVLPESVQIRDVVAEFFEVRERGGSTHLVPQPALDGVERPAIEVVDEGDSNFWRVILPNAVKIAGSTFTIGTSFLLSLLFSFLIVLDLPNLANGARHLRDTRLRFVYDEVSDNIVHFGAVLGRALEAQLMIAILNTAFTGIGLHFMGIPNIAFLCAIVFICSFIPVAGVFISSVPICLQTLTAKGDLMWVVYMVLFITLIHMIEAYILNPRIYGAHLKMNPVLVLSILVITHHLFGIWGLVLGVPITTYVYKYVICGRPRATDEDEDPSPAVPIP